MNEGGELLGQLYRLLAMCYEQEAQWEVHLFKQGFFLYSIKASASCSKFLMTTYHLKLSCFLKVTIFNSTISQDNLARKSDELNLVF